MKLSHTSILFALAGFMILVDGQVQNPNLDPAKRRSPKEGAIATANSSPKVSETAQQENPNKGNSSLASIWLTNHRNSLYQVCKSAVKNDSASIKLLDDKLTGKDDMQAVDIMTQFLDALLK